MMLVLSWLKQRITGAPQVASGLLVVFLMVLGSAGVYSAVAGVKSMIVAARDGYWRSMQAENERNHQRQRQEADDRAGRAVEEARATQETLEETRERVRQLEAALRAATTKSGNPIIYPKELVEEMIK